MAGTMCRGMKKIEEQVSFRIRGISGDKLIILQTFTYETAHIVVSELCFCTLKYANKYKYDSEFDHTLVNKQINKL